MNALVLPVPRRSIPAWLSAIAPALPALALLLATFDLSAGMSPDSHAYLRAAESIRQTGWIGDEFQLWPPLYPMLLSLGGAAFGAWLAKLGALATIIGVWAIGRTVVQSRYGLALGLLALVALPQFGTVFGFIWSETVYVPLAVWLTYFWARWLDGGKGLAAACVLLALALLTRHVGVVLAIAMAVTAVLARRPQALAVIAAACIPYALWVARTFALSGTYAGPRAPLENPDLLHQVELFGRVVGHWLVPHVYPLSGGMAVAAAFLLLFGAGLIHFYRQRQTALLFAALFVMGHSVLTVYSASRVSLDVNPRTLFPIFWAVLLAALWAVRALGRRAPDRAAPWFYIAVGLYCLLWFAAPNAIVNALI